MLEKLRNLRSSTLFANSIYLMISSAAIAGFGFIFWIITAKVFSDSEVGLAASLLSVSSLLSLLSLAGFDSTFIRFLPTAERRNDYINSGLMISFWLSIILSIGFIALIPMFTPDLSFVASKPEYIFYFAIFTAIATLNILTNSIFLAFKKALFILYINIFFSFIKVLLPLLGVGGDAMLIFIFAGLAQFIGLIASIWLIYKQFNFRFSFKIHTDIIKLSRRYAFSVYISSLLNLIPPAVLPLIVTQNLGPDASAYYYMAFTIATLLYTIAYSTMQSVFSEGSHNEAEFIQHLKKGAKLTLVLLLPAAIVIYVGAPFILGLFGKSYASGGTELLRLFTLASLFVTVYACFGVTFKVRRYTKVLVLMNLVYTSIIVAISFLLSPQFGLISIGWAWIAGNIGAMIVGGIAFLKLRQKLIK